MCQLEVLAQDIQCTANGLELPLHSWFADRGIDAYEAAPFAIKAVATHKELVRYAHLDIKMTGSGRLLQRGLFLLGCPYFQFRDGRSGEFGKLNLPLIYSDIGFDLRAGHSPLHSKRTGKHDFRILTAQGRKVLHRTIDIKCHGCRVEPAA